MNAKILIVDDNEDILFMLKAMLQLKEYTVFTKESVEHIESYIEHLEPDVILMDMLLSGADGREVCKLIKANAAISSVPIVMISAMPNARELCLEAGANYFVGKPFEMGDMFNAVAMAIANSSVSSTV